MRTRADAKYRHKTPTGGAGQFAEVWLQYRLQLRKPDGTIVIDWEVPGYGKAEIDGSQEDAVKS